MALAILNHRIIVSILGCQKSSKILIPYIYPSFQCYKNNVLFSHSRFMLSNMEKNVKKKKTKKTHNSNDNKTGLKKR